MKNETLEILTIDTHTMGDPTRIVVGGLPHIPGNTMLEKKQSLIENFDYIRSSLILEPRGHRDMFGAILLPPTMEEADIGVVFMDTQAYLNMCGHGTIGVTTALLEQKIIEKEGDEVSIVLETPAGLVNVTAQVDKDNGKVKEVSLVNVPSFLYSTDIELDIPNFKKIKVSIAFGGSYFVFVDADKEGIDLDTSNASYLAELGMLIKDIANDVIKVQHPQKPEINKIDLLLFIAESKNPNVNTKNVAIFGETQVARSACGTGLSAQLAYRYFTNQLEVNTPFNTESIIETVFKGEIVGTDTIDGLEVIYPKITGDAVVITEGKHLLNGEDPLNQGFLLNRKESIKTLISL